MYGRPFAIAAAAAMLLSSPAVAQQAPAAKDVRATQSQPQPAPTLLASADVRLPGAAKEVPVAAPAKPKRNARVTTCRCADVASQN